MEDIFDRVVNAAQVRPARKKYATFTVREIGGPDKIEEWRRQNDAKQAAFLERCEMRDTRVKASGITAFGLLSGKEKVSWADKQAFVKSERKRLDAPELINSKSWEPEPEIKPTFKQKVIGFFKSFWKSANF